MAGVRDRAHRLFTALFVAIVTPACGTVDEGDDVVDPPDPPTCERCSTMPPGLLYMVDLDGDAVVRYDATTGAFRDVFAAGIESRIDRPSSIRLGPDGNLYLAGFGAGDVLRFDARTGAMMDVFWWDTRILEEPVELAFRGDSLVVLGNDTRNAIVIDASGSAVENVGYPDMRAAHDFAFGPDGLLYVGADIDPERGTAIQVWDVTTGQLVRHFGTPDAIATATGVMFGADGLLYACDYDLDRVVRWDPTTGAPAGVLVDAGLLVDPVSLELGPDGALYVLDATGVLRFDPDTGAYLSRLVDAGDGHVAGARNFTFVTDAELAAALAD